MKTHWAAAVLVFALFSISMVSAECDNGVCDGDDCYYCPGECGCACDPCTYCGLCCPNGYCDNGETCATCPQDCDTCCGDDSCNNGETCLSCPGDCGECCGNGQVDPGETCDNCCEDVCTCPICPDGTCNGDENSCTCPEDCAVSCGDEDCCGSETCESCEADCGTCASCNDDGTCDDGEDACTCADCAVCGDGCCAPGEEGTCDEASEFAGSGPIEASFFTGSGGITASPMAFCRQDCCPALCGNGVCDLNEDCDNCRQDCQTNGVCCTGKGLFPPKNTPCTKGGITICCRMGEDCMEDQLAGGGVRPVCGWRGGGGGGGGGAGWYCYVDQVLTYCGPLPGDCTTPPCDGIITPYHSECLGESCVFVEGAGADACSSDEDCVTVPCGNGGLDPGEECDGTHGLQEQCSSGYVCDMKDTSQGDDDDDRCVCDFVAPPCGDGDPDPGEECDDGASNGVECPAPYGDSCTYCSLLCENVVLYGGYCGDETTDAGYEVCDDGAANGVPCTPPYGGSCSYCLSDCSGTEIIVGPYCGDWTIDVGYGEECDDGNNNNGDGCSALCRVEVAGACGTGLNDCDSGDLRNVGMDDTHYTWDCVGTTSTDHCSMPRPPSCGTAARVYGVDPVETFWGSDSLCGVGGPSPASPSLGAAEGSTVSWDCVRFDGAESVTCTAVRETLGGSCGDGIMNVVGEDCDGTHRTQSQCGENYFCDMLNMSEGDSDDPKCVCVPDCGYATNITWNDTCEAGVRLPNSWNSTFMHGIRQTEPACPPFPAWPPCVNCTDYLTDWVVASRPTHSQCNVLLPDDVFRPQTTTCVRDSNSPPDGVLDQQCRKSDSSILNITTAIDDVVSPQK